MLTYGLSAEGMSKRAHRSESNNTPAERQNMFRIKHLNIFCLQKMFRWGCTCFSEHFSFFALKLRERTSREQCRFTYVSTNIKYVVGCLSSIRHQLLLTLVMCQEYHTDVSGMMLSNQRHQKVSLSSERRIVDVSNN